MSPDDQINFVILAVVLIFAAIAFPNLVAYERDAQFGAAVRQPFNPDESESRTEDCVRATYDEEKCVFDEMKRMVRP